MAYRSTTNSNHLSLGVTEFESTIFFVASDGTNGRELWKTDGTEVGTVLVKDIFLGSASSAPSGFTEFDGNLFFNAFDDIGVIPEGSRNNDLLGTNGDDILNGTDDIALGAGEVDRLIGGGNADTFVLGNEAMPFYAAERAADRAIIKGFNAADDTVGFRMTYSPT